MSRTIASILLVIAAIALFAVWGYRSHFRPAPAKPVHVTPRIARLAAKLPALDKVKYIRGRAATDADLKAGVAVFAQLSGDKSVGTPSTIDIPQYAIYTDEKGNRTPGIVTQAEYSPQLRKEVVAVLLPDGQHTACLRSQLQLLGDKRPQ